MVKCTNCSNSAAYTNTDLGGNHTHYCVECLPNWLQARAQAGEFPLVTRIEEAESKSSKRKKSVEEKPAVEVAETPVEEAPAPAEEAPADENN